MFRIDIFSVSDHSMVRMKARPGIKATTLVFLGEICALFIMKATLAVALGLVGSQE